MQIETPLQADHQLDQLAGQLASNSRSAYQPAHMADNKDGVFALAWQ